MRQPMALARAQYERFRLTIDEFAKFAVIGIAGVFVTNAIYDLLYLRLGLGPVTSTTIATAVATIASYLGNRYWSFQRRQRSRVVREIVVFAVLNGIGLLIQDATVAFNYYLLGLGHNKLAGFIALNAGIVLATLFRFWSYRRYVWTAPPAGRAGDTGSRHGRPASRRGRHPPRTAGACADPSDHGPSGPGHPARDRLPGWRRAGPRDSDGKGTAVPVSGRPSGGPRSGRRRSPRTG